MSEKTKDVLLSIFASLLCIVIGLLVGLIILYCINAENALDGFSRIIKGGFYLKPKGIGSEIAQATPLIMTGLSVAFAFKTGLFNIGAAGQYTLGVFGALYFALILQMPWYVCLLAAMVCGAIWGAVPGIFKAYFNVNEVITSIMFNWIGLYLVNELMYSTVSGMYDQKTTRTYKLSSAAPQSLIPDCGMSAVFKTSSTTIAIFIAMAIAIIMYVVLNKTTFGYELKACGFNKDAAKYAAEFTSTATDFRVILKNVNYNLEGDAHQVIHQVIELSTVSKQILAFCTTPKSKKELAVFCGFKDLRNFTLKHINPLLESGQLEMTIPDKPKSRNQKYITVRSE